MLTSHPAVRRSSILHRLPAAAFAVAVVALLGGGAGAAGPAPGVGIDLLENTPERVVLRFEFGAVKETQVTIDGAPYVVLDLGEESPTMIAGDPRLPTVNRSLIVSNAARMEVRVRDVEFYELSRDVAPSKGSILRTVDPATVPYRFGKAYDTDAFYPGPLARLGDPYILRDHRGATLEVLPFQYNPVSGTLRVYTSMTVEVVAAGAGGANVLDAAAPKRPSAVFHEIYQSHFLNYEAAAGYVPLDEQGEMLVICHEPWIPNMMPFVAHKNAIGIPTSIVAVSSIPGGNNSTAIKSYIQSVYDTSDLAFVLLVGDGAQVDTPSASGGSSDPSYALLAGTDSYPEIIVGRFSAETPAHVDTQVQRTIEYETMPATMQDWFKMGVGIASNQGPGHNGEYDNEHMDLIRDDLLAYGYTVVDQIYDPSGTAAQVSNALNHGRGIINYCGHGSTTSWGTTGFSNSNVDALTNDSMLPFICSVACVNGQFDGYTCFGEAWLRATHGAAPTGAIGAYMSSINQYWDEPMAAEDEFCDLICNERLFSYGALCYSGSCRMMDEYGSSGIDMYKTWHIFGDPSLRVYGTAEPPTGMYVLPFSDLAAEGPHGGPFTPGEIVYTLENMNDAAIDYEVTHGATWVEVLNASGHLEGHATVEITVMLSDEVAGFPNGYFEDTIQITNLTTHEGDTERTVGVTIGIPTLQYAWDGEIDPGWSAEGLWAWGVPAGQGGVEHGNPDPAGGRTGSNVFGYNLSGDYENYLAERHLTTTAIDCTDLSDVRLSFWRWLNVETSTYDHAYVRVSNNGSAWTTVWENNGEVADSAWSLQEFDVSAVADGQPTVYVRWTMGTTDSSWQYSGWNVDDIEMMGVPLVDCNGNNVVDHVDIAQGSSSDDNANGIPDECECPADVNGDGVVGFDDVLSVLSAWGPCGNCPADVDANGMVGFTDLLAVLSAWGPC